jgi:hypothetical protein
MAADALMASVTLCRRKLMRAVLVCASLAVLAACTQGTQLSVSEATRILERSRVFPQPVEISLAAAWPAEEIRRRPQLKQQIDALERMKLLTLSNDGEQVRLKPGAAAGSSIREDTAGKSLLLRQAERQLDKILSVGELRTSQGVKVRDTTVEWRYGSVTPVGALFGLKEGVAGRSQIAAVYFADGWRYVKE